MPYALVIGDNFHPRGDPGHASEAGTYATAEEAIAAAKQVIDKSLANCFKPGMGAETLIERFSGFGEVTSIFAGEGDAKALFDPWAYATARAAIIARAAPK